jgi:hypothetical protein
MLNDPRHPRHADTLGLDNAIVESAASTSPPMASF